ncbi:MAG TPA: hypothetical protein VMN60_09240 [Longimicrobiales bacterium]|nr:hypothetical protein [Longimicrobiales bacterium]
MNPLKHRAGRRASAAAALLLLAGGLLGIVVDRLWLMPRQTGAMPLTAQAMVARLDLDATQEVRIRALLDSIHAEILAAAAHGPDSLRAATHGVQHRLEAALPPERRTEFRDWMHEHHRQLIQRMGAHR